MDQREADDASARAVMREDPAVFDDVRSPHLFLPVLTRTPDITRGSGGKLSLGLPPLHSDVALLSSAHRHCRSWLR